MDRKLHFGGPRLAALTLALTLDWVGVAGATTWHNGDMVTFSQYEWGADPAPSALDSAASLLNANYNTIYAASFGTLEIGVPGTHGFSIFFGSASGIAGYLPASGPAGSLDADLLDPSSSASGEFGGLVTALRLNIDFYDAGILSYASPYRFGDLILHDLPALPNLDGLTVRQLEHLDEIVLGGGSAAYNIADLSALTEQVCLAFGLGFATQFANDHLAAPVPEPSSVLSLAIGTLGLVITARWRASRRRRPCGGT